MIFALLSLACGPRSSEAESCWRLGVEVRPKHGVDDYETLSDTGLTLSQASTTDGMIADKMLIKSLVIAGAALAAPEPHIQGRGIAAGQCTDITIPVQAGANNVDIFAPTDDLTSLSGVTSFLSSLVGALGQLTSFIPQSGTYNISGRYCAPATGGHIPAERANHVQILLHGIPYEKSYWQGLNYAPTGDTNNWLAYANAQGYPTLAIDNLGDGQSTRADPIFVVQQSLETVILQELIGKLRTGTVNPVVPKASKVIFVGHSAGSITGNGVAVKYPTAAFDAAILTGYSYTIAQATLGLITGAIVPASIQNPARFGNLSPGYLTFASVEGKRNIYFGTDDSFDPGLPAWDVNQAQDTFTIGDLVSVTSGLQTANGYTGDIFVLTGDQDELFCGLGTREFGKASCGTGSDSLLAKTQSLWPDVRSYEYHAVPKAGHAVTLHNSAQDQFARAHDFLARQGY